MYFTVLYRANVVVVFAGRGVTFVGDGDVAMAMVICRLARF